MASLQSLFFIWQHIQLKSRQITETTTTTTKTKILTKDVKKSLGQFTSGHIKKQLQIKHFNRQIVTSAEELMSNDKEDAGW